MAVFEEPQKYTVMRGIHSCHSNYSADRNFFRKTEVKSVCCNGTRAALASCASRPLAVDEVYAQNVASWTLQNCRCLSLTMAPFEFECQNDFPQDQGLFWRNSFLSVLHRGLLKAWLSCWVNFSDKTCDCCPSVEGAVQTQQNRQTSQHSS